MFFSFSLRAARQVDEIYNYIAHDNPAAAQKVVDRIYSVAGYLADYPHSGHPTCVGDIRVYPAHPYPYLVYFRSVSGRDEVRILRVRHASRRPLNLNDPPSEFLMQKTA